MTLFLKAVWEWHTLEKTQAAIDSVFNRAAYLVRPFWYFIFTVGTQFGFAATPDESWAVREFLFGIGNGQDAKMERIASAFTNAFGQPLNIEQAASWLQEIIVSTVFHYTFLNYADNTTAREPTAD